MEHAEKGNLYLRIIRDGSPSDPRDDDNLGTMYCWPNRMSLGDPCPHESSRDALVELASGVVTPIEVFRPDQIMYYNPKRTDRDESGLCLSPTDDFDAFTWEELREIASNVNVMLPIYLYDHGGITISTSAFSCRWDSGLVGFIFCSRERFLSETGYTAEELFKNGKAESMLENEVKTYDQYLTGEVFGIEYGTIKEKTWVCKETGEEEIEKEYNETESVWGFYGDDHVKSGLMDELPDAYKELVPLLEECDDDD